MSEPQPPIPAEDLERIEKAALIVYPVRMGTVGDCRKEYDLNEEYREDWTNGAKAEHCHLRERIEQLEAALNTGTIDEGPCTCTKETQHGATTVWCCNHCGRPMPEEQWTWWSELKTIQKP